MPGFKRREMLGMLASTILFPSLPLFRRESKRQVISSEAITLFNLSGDLSCFPEAEHGVLRFGGKLFCSEVPLKCGGKRFTWSFPPIPCVPPTIWGDRVLVLLDGYLSHAMLNPFVGNGGDITVEFSEEFPRRILRDFNCQSAEDALKVRSRYARFFHGVRYHNRLRRMSPFVDEPSTDPEEPDWCRGVSKSRLVNFERIMELGGYYSDPKFDTFALLPEQFRLPSDRM